MAEGALVLVDRLEAHFIAGRETEFLALIESLSKVHEALQMPKLGPLDLKGAHAAAFFSGERRCARALLICSELRAKTRKIQETVQGSYKRVARARAPEPAEPVDPERAAAYAEIERMRASCDADLGVVDAMLAVVDRAEAHSKAGRLDEATRLFRVFDHLSGQLDLGDVKVRRVREE